ncbi:MAG: hypothetical protein WCA37_16845 [Terracidiphilus sp.]
MKRTWVLFAVGMVLAVTALAQTTSTAKPEKLSRQQLLSLIATAQTPELADMHRQMAASAAGK